MFSRNAAGVCACASILLAFSLPAHAHGVSGQRFFPATMAVEDPFVADEAGVPTISSLKEPGGAEPATRETEYEFEFAKRITPKFGLSVGQAYVRRHTDGEEGVAAGFSNVNIGARYQFLLMPRAEAVASLDLGFEIGGTGARRVEAERYSRFEPSLLFGKGLGDLPDALWALKPLALTGQIGASVPFARRQLVSEEQPGGALESHFERLPRSLTYGVTLQYSLSYLQANVRDVGLGDGLRRLTPLIELAFERPLDGSGGERTTGTVNPGFVWCGNKIQLGAEAIVPINGASGSGIGFRAQVHLYLDDLLNESFGKPLIGE